MFTALLAKILEEKKILPLNSKLSDFFREEHFKIFADPEAAKNITLEMLLSHTSGLQYDADCFNNKRGPLPLDTILSSMDEGGIYLFANPGDGIYSYSNQIGLAALLIEKSYKKLQAQELIAQGTLGAQQPLGDIYLAIAALQGHIEQVQKHLEQLLSEERGSADPDPTRARAILALERALPQLHRRCAALEENSDSLSKCTFQQVLDAIDARRTTVEGVYVYDLLDQFLAKGGANNKISYADILRTELLEPLGMHRTSFHKPADSNVVQVYKLKDDGKPSSVEDFEVLDPMMQGAGGLWSSMGDMMKLGQSLSQAYFNGKPLMSTTPQPYQLLSSAALEDLATHRGISGQAGLGIDLEGSVIGKGGGIASYDFKLKVDRSTKSCITSLCNFCDNPLFGEYIKRVEEVPERMNPNLSEKKQEQQRFDSLGIDRPKLKDPPAAKAKEIPAEIPPFGQFQHFYKGPRGYIAISEAGAGKEVKINWNGQLLNTERKSKNRFLILGDKYHAGKEVRFIKGKKSGQSYVVIEKGLESTPFREIGRNDKEWPEIGEIIKVGQDKNFELFKDAEGTYSTTKPGGPPAIEIKLNNDFKGFSLTFGKDSPVPVVITKISEDNKEVWLMANAGAVPDKLFKLVANEQGRFLKIADFITKVDIEAMPILPL